MARDRRDQQQILPRYPRRGIGVSSGRREAQCLRGLPDALELDALGLCRAVFRNKSGRGTGEYRILKIADLGVKEGRVEAQAAVKECRLGADLDRLCRLRLDQR